MKLNRCLFPCCRSIATGLAVTVGLMAFNSSLNGDQEARAVKPSDCMPAVSDYTYMWWAHGWRSPAKVLAFQTGHYCMVPDGGVTVWLGEGTYYLGEPLVFGPEDSGTAEKPIVYRGFAGQKPTISGGVV
jgi:hypothetical protein